MSILYIFYFKFNVGEGEEGIICSMNNIFSFYTSYKNHIDDYNKLTSEKELKVNQKKCETVLKHSDADILKQKAKVIAEPLLVADYYEHEKAEDAETFYQTFNIELLSAAAALSSLPVAVTKLIPFFNKHSSNNILNGPAKKLTSYSNYSVSMFGRKIKLSKILTVPAVILSGIIYAYGIKKSMQSQLGLIRKSSFDASQNIINDPKIFAIPTTEQDEQIKKASENSFKQSSLADKIKDKTNIKSSFDSVKEYNKNYKQYIEQKNEYLKSLEQNGSKKYFDTQNQEAKENQQLFENMLKNVEFNSLEKLRKIETISNITYSSLFTGGFLEYLITDKLVDVLHIKNKPLQIIVKLGAPLITYLLMNKNISDIENKAILAAKYKNLKNFIENPSQYNIVDETSIQTPFEFVKSTLKDMKDYDKFAQTELPEIRTKLEAKKSLEYTPVQMNNAKTMQKNTSMVLNEHRENIYNQSVGIKSLSETILGPVDIISTALGGLLGSKLAGMLLKNPDNKSAGLLKGLGAVATFIPAAILEAKLTKQQKLSEKIAAAMTINNLKDENKFADDFDLFSNLKFNNKNHIFNEFTLQG